MHVMANIKERASYRLWRMNHDGLTPIELRIAETALVTVVGLALLGLLYTQADPYLKDPKPGDNNNVAFILRKGGTVEAVIPPGTHSGDVINELNEELGATAPASVLNLADAELRQSGRFSKASDANGQYSVILAPWELNADIPVYPLIISQIQAYRLHPTP